MLETPKRDRRAERREATREEILEHAWALCREEGLAGLSLRELAARVGMKAPSLYSYFESKHAIYDAMFAQGSRAFDAMDRGLDEQGGGTAPPMRRPPTDDLAVECGRRLRAFVEFCSEDVVRYQLLFQRTIPGFEPSPSSYALSVETLDRVAGRLDAWGVGGAALVDLMTAIGSGLAAQQIANDPGGDRWARLAEEAGVMFVAHARSRVPTSPPRAQAPGTARRQDS